jgi:SAM-dependent methyltransferase
MKNSANTPGELERIYRIRFDGRMDYRIRVWKILVNKFFSRYVPSDAAVLDLGCGHGEFINNVQCEKKFALDLNPAARQYLHPNVVFLEQDCSAPWNIPESALDVVFTSNFFEHLPSRQVLNDTIAQARRALRPGGRLIAMGPNIRFVGGAYWDFYDHQIPLTDSSAAEMLRLQQFRIDESRDRFLPYTMVNTRPIPEALISVYLTVPVLWKFFGKQFLIIATRP